MTNREQLEFIIDTLEHEAKAADARRLSDASLNHVQRSYIQGDADGMRSAASLVRRVMKIEKLDDGERP